MKGVCEKCGYKGLVTRHHIMPVTFFGKFGDVSLLCRDCHNEIEQVYEIFEGKTKQGRRIKLKRRCYRRIFENWINEKLWKKEN
jgi:hypothetical protein